MRGCTGITCGSLVLTPPLFSSPLPLSAIFGNVLIISDAAPTFKPKALPGTHATYCPSASNRVLSPTQVPLPALATFFPISNDTCLPLVEFHPFLLCL